MDAVGAANRLKNRVVTAMSRPLLVCSFLLL